MPKARITAKDTLKYDKIICPSAEELSVITNNVPCDQCGLVFQNEPRYRLHNLKVHERKNLSKSPKENVRYHCPIQSCIYAPESQRHFSTMKYLKQHYLKVHAEKIFACTRCIKSFSTEAAKESHMRICGTEFTCSCTKTYTTYEALLTHAKRLLHPVDDKYKSTVRRTHSKMIQIIPSDIMISEMIESDNTLPMRNKLDKSSHNGHCKITYNVGVQTDECKRYKRIKSLLKCNSTNGHNHSGKRNACKQTQTNALQKKKYNGRSMETQTTEALQEIKDSLKVHKRRRINDIAKKLEHSLLKEDLSLGDNFASTNLFSNSPLPLRHDVGLQDLWEEKNSSSTQTIPLSSQHDGLSDFWEEKNSSSTQTIPEKVLLEDLNDNVTQTEFETFYDHDPNPLIQCVPKSTVASMTLPCVEDTSTVVGTYSFQSSDEISQSDPMLTVKPFDDKFSSIETQTEQTNCQSFFDSDALSRTFTESSNIETQTTDNFDNMEQLLYNNTCTQTCNEILQSYLGLSNIETQTAWTQLDDTTVSTETQTKLCVCESDCNISIGTCCSLLNTQTSHTETQTDLLSIFERLQ